MIEAIILDSSPLGLMTGREDKLEAQACRQWALHAMAAGVSLYVPEIADYEVRRELIRAGKNAGIGRLNALLSLVTYLPLTTATMRLAAELWAQARNSGLSTADNAALDGDVIVAAQALSLNRPRQSFVVATENVRHLGRFAPAQKWDEIVVIEGI